MAGWQASGGLGVAAAGVGLAAVAAVVWLLQQPQDTAPEAGHKQREGDERTPEGRYVIDWRNARSVAHLSLHISYPDARDQAAAAQAGVSPGGAVMIHGLPNGWGAIGRWHRLADWTDGCIGVTNAEMREIWARVPDGTPIEIRP